MSWPSILCLVRHAESFGNTIDVDSRAAHELATWKYPLTEFGRNQAKITSDYLHNTYGSFDVYYTSYYLRAKETMQILYPERERFYEDPRLAEAQRGIYHTMTRDQIAAKYPEELARKEREGLYHYRPPGGENWPDIEMRVHSFLGTLIRDCSDKKVLIVVHGHWLVLFERLIQHFGIEEAVERYKQGVVENASVTTYASVDEHLQKTSYSVPWKGILTESLTLQRPTT